MRNTVKRVAALMVSLCLTASLTACGGGETSEELTKEDALVYVAGLLEENYYGTASDEYMKLVGIDEDDVEATYHQSMEVGVEFFIYNYSIESPTDKLREDLEEMYEEIYSQAKFQVVSAAQQEDGSYSVKVTVSPLNIAHLAEETLEEALEPWYEKYPTEVLEEMDEDSLKAADEEWAKIIYNAYQDKLDEMGYLSEQSISVQLEMDEDGYYCITNDDFYRLDALTLDYPYYEG